MQAVHVLAINSYGGFVLGNAAFGFILAYLV